MSKFSIMLAVLLFSLMPVFAGDIGGLSLPDRRVTIEFHGSFKSPYKMVSLQLASKNGLRVLKRPIEYELTVRVAPTVSAESTLQTFAVSEADFDAIYSQCRAFNVQEILDNRQFGGFDGYQVAVTYGNSQNYASISLWSISYDTDDRKIRPVYDLCKEVFALAGIEDAL